MTRREFGIKISQLFLQMVKEGEQPIYDYFLRSSEEQNRLYNQGLSKMDGYIKKSAHQLGKGADIYLCDSEGTPAYDWNKEKAQKWHKIWEEMGGKPLIVFTDGTWDSPHFEG